MITSDAHEPVVQSAGDIVVAALKTEGVEVAFGLVGSHILGLYESLRTQSWLKHVTIRHETNAGFMAHAYAVGSGKVPAIFTTAGPGVLNALGAIGHCYFQSIPLVMISAASQRTGCGRTCMERRARISRHRLRQRSLSGRFAWHP